MLSLRKLVDLLMSVVKDLRRWKELSSMAKAKSKKITLEEALVPVEEQPYEVPENWCWVKLSYIADIRTGRKMQIIHLIPQVLTQMQFWI